MEIFQYLFANKLNRLIDNKKYIFKKGAKLFYLTGLVNNEYRRNEVHNLARFISVMKFKDVGYRLNHSFVIADRFIFLNKLIFIHFTA